METENQIVNGEEFHLEDKLGQLWELGFNPYNMKLLTVSYRTSKVAMSGCDIDCGHFSIKLGPQTSQTLKVPKLSLEALDYLGLNPYAVRALAREFIDSKVKRNGLHAKIDDIVLMIGPQNKNTFILR